MSKRDALQFIMPKGRYKGQTLGVIYAENKGYLEWCYETFDVAKDQELMMALSYLVDDKELKQSWKV